MKPIIQMIVCQNTNSNFGNMSIENPYSLISFPDMPTSASFKIAAVVGRFDINKVYPIGMRMMDPDGKVIFESGDSEIGPFVPPNDEVSRLENLNFDFSITNVRLVSEGDYTFELMFGDQFIQQIIAVEHVPID